NLTRFILFKTIFFSKEIAPRKAVQESFALGIEKNRDLWCIILSMVLFALAVAVLSIIVVVPIGAMGVSSEIIDVYVSPIITLLLTTPMLLIITAKGYVKIRD
ncbi:hypothetical protein H7X65_01060, partial [Candidatus Parcubacteria bacterium]|nr:hypothetical protein [Candidatus Parcubacteria bacterium]